VNTKPPVYFRVIFLFSLQPFSVAEAFVGDIDACDVITVGSGLMAALRVCLGRACVAVFTDVTADVTVDVTALTSLLTQQLRCVLSQQQLVHESSICRPRITIISTYVTLFASCPSVMGTSCKKVVKLNNFFK